MNELQELAKVFSTDDASWIHDGRPEQEWVERGDWYINFLFSSFPDLKLLNGFRALEIGSGLGTIMEALERYARLQGLRAARIIGLDIAAPMLEKAKARLSDRPFEFLHYDGVHIPLEDGSLDFVYSAATLHHIPKSFVYNLFFEIKRLLSPTGFSLLHLMDFSHIPHCIQPWADTVSDQVKGGERSTGWIYFYSAEELRWVLGHGTGFKEVRVVGGEALTVALSNVSSAPKPGLEQAAPNSAALRNLQDEHATLSASFANLKDEHATLSASFSNLKDEHATLSTSFANLKDENTTLSASFANLKDENTTLSASFANLKDEHTTLSASRANLEEELRAIRASRSWKITAPLRGITTVIRGR